MMLLMNPNNSFLKRFKSKLEEDLENEGLPANTKHPKLQLKNTEYIKLYMQKSQLHEDREKASNICQNLGEYFNFKCIFIQGILL